MNKYILIPLIVLLLGVITYRFYDKIILDPVPPYTKEFDQSRSYYEHGKKLIEDKKIDEAIVYYNKSLKIQKELNYEKNIAVLYYLLGEAYILSGKYDTALEFFIKSNKLEQKYLRPVQLTDISLNICIVYYLKGEQHNAINTCSKTMDMLDKYGIGQANRLEAVLDYQLIIAETFIKRNMYDEVYPHLKKAYYFAEKHDFNGKMNSISIILNQSK